MGIYGLLAESTQNFTRYMESDAGDWSKGRAPSAAFLRTAMLREKYGYAINDYRWRY